MDNLLDKNQREREKKVQKTRAYYQQIEQQVRQRPQQQQQQQQPQSILRNNQVKFSNEVAPSRNELQEARRFQQNNNGGYLPRQNDYPQQQQQMQRQYNQENQNPQINKLQAGRRILKNSVGATGSNPSYGQEKSLIDKISEKSLERKQQRERQKNNLNDELYQQIELKKNKERELRQLDLMLDQKEEERVRLELMEMRQRFQNENNQLNQVPK